MVQLAKFYKIYLDLFNDWISFGHFCLLRFLKNFFEFLSALGLHCCARAFSSCGEWGLLFIVVRALLIVVASLVSELEL